MLPCATYRQETRMHAQMTVSPSPHAPKSRQHGLTYIPTGWTIASKDRRTSWWALRTRCTTTHTVSTCKIWPSTSRNLQNLRPPLFDVLSKGLTCYTDVESTRDASYQNPNRQTCDLRRDTCSRDDGLSKPPCSQSVASTV
jgi:hypothetical protein